MTRRAVGLSLMLLAASLIALGSAPLLIDDSYDLVTDTLSESGAQGVDGAWLANLGFLAFGLAVVLISGRAAFLWGQRAAAFHRVFGLGMIAVSAFSAHSWDDAAPYDQTEDMLHSLAATVAGFAFALGVLAVTIRRAEAGRRVRVFDVVAMAAAVVLPLAMSFDEAHQGVWQRSMFAIAFIWYGREAIGASVSVPSTAAGDVREMH